MADDGASTPLLATWADVDPARHPFDPVEMSVAVRALVPPPLPRPAFRDGGWVGESEAFAWVDSVSVLLSDRYGQWAYRWHWGPVEREQLGFVTDRIPTPAEAPAFVADSLLAWRRWLESLAERFDHILPSLDAAQTGGAADVVAAWEAAVAQLMTFVAAPVVDDDGWQEYCKITLRWFLTATGIPPDRAQAMVDGALERFGWWPPLTAMEISEVAERVARDVLNPGGIATVARVDSWPDTWPHGWPSWRATNTGKGAGSSPHRGHSA
ncbi:hypothetical protein ACIA47_26820 [Micromonospora sp. NPDC051227]|uniref:hypothetical protein n=1 Tax=Micromonospora sp. NPDC051227 TaxID=3364285 RepID=UPI00379D5D03